MATSSGAQVHQATLSVAFVLQGPQPRRLVLEGVRGYPVMEEASLEAAGARADAFAALSADLCGDAAEWIAYGEWGGANDEPQR